MTRTLSNKAINLFITKYSLPTLFQSQPPPRPQFCGLFGDRSLRTFRGQEFFPFSAQLSCRPPTKAMVRKGSASDGGETAEERKRRRAAADEEQRSKEQRLGLARRPPGAAPKHLDGKPMQWDPRGGGSWVSQLGAERRRRVPSETFRFTTAPVRQESAPLSFAPNMPLRFGESMGITMISVALAAPACAAPTAPATPQPSQRHCSDASASRIVEPSGSACICATRARQAWRLPRPAQCEEKLPTLTY